MNAAPRHRSRPVHAALSALLLAALAAQPAMAEVDRYLIDTGPLRIRDQFLPGLGFLGFDPVAADVLEEDEWQVDFLMTSSNSFANSAEVERVLSTRTGRESLGLNDLRGIEPDQPGDGIFHVDGEHRRWALAARRGIGHGMHVEVMVPVLQLTGGFLDSGIESFHDAFSLGQAGRPGVPRDDFRVYTRRPGHETYLDHAPGTVLGDISVGVRYDLLRVLPGAPRDPQQSPFRLSVEGLVKLPTGDEDSLAGSGSTDFGVQVIGANYFARGCLHYSLGAIRLGRHELLDLDPQTVLSGMVAWEAGLGDKTTGVVQATFSQSPFSGLESDEIDAASTQITLGVKHAFGPSVVFVGLTENISNFNNTADIGLHLGLTRVFGGH